MKGVTILMLIWYTCVVGGAPLCPDFDSQVHQLLAHEMMTPQEIVKILLSFKGLEYTLQTRWHGAELFLYVTGLATKTSDVDLYLRIPNYNETADAYFINETVKLLYKEPEKYGQFELRLNVSDPMMTYYDIGLQRHIDLSFRCETAVVNYKIIEYYLNLDHRFLPLASIIKVWCEVHQLTVKFLMPNYATYLLVIFYLQQNNMAPAGYKTQTDLPLRIVNKWNTNFKMVPFTIENNHTLYKLLGGFFKYYTKFDFKKNCVSPFAGRPVARRDFDDVETVPDEFTFYKSVVKAGSQDALPLQADMCIQDIFEHNSNIVGLANSSTVLKFINHIKISAKMYDELPRDQFLSSILIKD